MISTIFREIKTADYSGLLLLVAWIRLVMWVNVCWILTAKFASSPMPAKVEFGSMGSWAFLRIYCCSLLWFCLLRYYIICFLFPLNIYLLTTLLNLMFFSVAFVKTPAILIYLCVMLVDCTLQPQCWSNTYTSSVLNLCIQFYQMKLAAVPMS